MDNKLLHFKLAYECFKLPRNVVFTTYEWLGSLFNLYDIGEEKNTLDTNLMDFISNKNLENIRRICYILRHLENIFLNFDENNLNRYDYFDKINYKYKYVLKITEKFLSEGPGNIPCIDNEIKCKKCDFKTNIIPCFDLEIFNNNKRNHDFKTLNCNNFICNKCGFYLSTITAESSNYYKCIDIDNICVNHVFDIE